MNKTFSILFLGALVACANEDPIKQEHQPAVASQAPPPSPPPPPEPPKPKVVTVAVATFRSEQLDECVDFGAVLPHDASEEEEKEVRGRFSKPVLDREQEKGVKVVVVKKVCAEAFPDRATVASCVLSDRKITFRDAEVPALVSAVYFSRETARKTDSFMRQCLEMGGDWKESAPAPAPRLRLLR